jgi:pimeloyl-ACP methyl ester carboxylesterase
MTAPSPSIILIHGMWMTPRSWDQWIDHYADRGYRAIAPGWPGIDREPEEIRRDPSPLKGLGIKACVDHYEQISRGLDAPPIIIGHSFGGLITQILVGRGHGRAAVALDPAAPKGIKRVPLSSLRAAATAIAHPSTRHGTVDLDFDQFHYAFTNTWEPEAARAAFDRYAVPETGRIFFQDGFANFTLHGETEVDFDREERGPLLITVGEHDHTVPPSVAKENFNRYRDVPATTEFVEFPGRSHLLMDGDGWEEVAQYIADWLDRVLRP